MLEDHPEYILSHQVNEHGETTYYVKWLGCDVTDNTWETEKKLEEEWPSALRAYREKLERGEEMEMIKHIDIKKVFEYTESIEDWESEVDEIAYIEKAKIPGFIVYVNWKNGYKSVHHSSEVYAKCPQKMIEFFEKFAQFNEIFDEQ